MILFAILISLFLERGFAHLTAYRRFDWFESFSALMRKRIGEFGAVGEIALLAVLLPPVLLVAFADSVLRDVLFNLPALLFYTAVMFLSLGPRDLEQQVQSLLDAWDRDEDEKLVSEAGVLLGEAPPREPHSLQRALSEAILIQANERVTAILFWFVLLGPLGAVLFRLNCHLKNMPLADGETAGPFQNAAARLHDILSYVPAHLTALGYALAGSFVDAFHHWRSAAEHWRGDWRAAVEGTLVSGGLGAVQFQFEQEQDLEIDKFAFDHHLRALLGLIWRTLIVWVVVIALLTMVGWTA